MDKQKVKKTYKAGAKQMKNTGNFSTSAKKPGKNVTHAKGSKKHNG